MIGIKAIGTYLPEARTSNFDRLKKFGMTESFVQQKIGFTEVALKAPEQETSDLCVKSWEDLQQKHPVSPEEIDCVIVCTQNPDGHGLPHTSAIVHEKLSLPLSCAAFDLSLGCSGYVYGLSVINSFMEANSFKNGLLFTADPYSKVMNKDDKKTATLFGDGASVTLLNEDPVFECGKFVFGSDGCKKEGIIVREDGYVHMNGRAVFTFTVRVVPDNIRNMLEKNSTSLDSVDRFILHQGSLHIVNSIADALGVPRERCPFYSAKYGNTVSSSVPMVLSREIDNQEMKVAVLSGFGVGLSWASTMLYRK
ncbi:MAG: 3-oxoacyl-[acyl-carrier-protein] synthase 3 [Deltaproteobacteria bacterium]|jgi:3-oxoacyl-[acyl-carrier-protein] synthase-3|nr:3-oxoacyl-[acyl-carrier-protein] synthase 3 [Deltaproteobacteria bacterium]